MQGHQRWRWWVVHLWVEGFFEVFATGVVAFQFTTLGLVRVASATRAALASTSVFLMGGIPGTLHHLYFSGTPVGVTAIGAAFSALEVVPLVLIGREALETLRMKRRAAWTERYRWPLHFNVGVAFWNLVGAACSASDAVFVSGVAALAWFMIGLRTGWSYSGERLRSPREGARSPAREEALVGAGSRS